MPFPMIHMEVARLVKAKCGIGNTAQYYLGTIAPDAVHIRAGMSGEDKKAAHLCTDGAAWGEVTDNAGWRDNVLDFLRTNTAGDRDFLLGYCVHILTDIYWNEKVYMPFKRHYKGPVKDMRSVYRDDCLHMESSLCGLCDWRDVMHAYLENAKGMAICNIGADEVDAWSREECRFFDSMPVPDGGPRYITLADGLDFIRDAGERIYDWVSDCCIAGGRD